MGLASLVYSIMVITFWYFISIFSSYLTCWGFPIHKVKMSMNMCRIVTKEIEREGDMFVYGYSSLSHGTLGPAVVFIHLPTKTKVWDMSQSSNVQLVPKMPSHAALTHATQPPRIDPCNKKHGWRATQELPATEKLTTICNIYYNESSEKGL